MVVAISSSRATRKSHCAAYTIDGQDIFICHGYSVAQQGAPVLIQRPIRWTSDGWPEL